MGETKVTKTMTQYTLTDGTYSIIAMIDECKRKITIQPGMLVHNDREFVFMSSKPEVAWAIGTLLRDAADLVKE